MLSEIGRHRKTNAARSDLYVEFKKVNLTEAKSRMVAAGGWGGGNGRRCSDDTNFQLQDKFWGSNAQHGDSSY